MLKNEEKKRRPQDKWDEKAGVVPKTYKVNKEVAIEFQMACRKAGVSMGTKLTEMMKQFVAEVKASE